MNRRTPRSTCTYTLFLYTTLVRSAVWQIEYGPSRHRQHSRSSPCGRDWHRPTESSTSSIIQNHPAAMGGRSLTGPPFFVRSEEHTSELQSLMSTSYAGFCLQKKKNLQHRLQILDATLSILNMLHTRTKTN